MPFKNESEVNTTYTQTTPPLKPLETYLEFSGEDDTLIITKKVWNQEKREYNDAFVVKLDVTMLANLGERLDKIEEMAQKLGASVRKLQKKH